MSLDLAALPTPGNSCPDDSHQGDVATFMACLDQSPFRRPDWRWQLAAQLHVDRRLQRRPEFRDPWVKRVRKALRVDTVGARLRLRRRDRAFGEVVKHACQVRFHQDPLVPAEVEAWLLTGSSPAMVADQCGLPVEVVETYEKLFFDVRHRLKAVGHILQVVIGPPIHYGFSLDDLGAIWKFCAYMRGPHALDVLLHVFPGGKPRPWPSTFPATPSEQRALIAVCKRMVWTRCFGLADMSPADVVRLLLLNEWGQELHEADCVKLSGIGAISKVDVSSLVEPRAEDLDSITAASCSSLVSILRGGCTGAGGGGTSDGNKQAGAGSTGLDLSGKPVEPAHRVTA